MNNEKILSNQELLDITGGYAFLSQEDLSKQPLIKRNFEVCEYGVVKTEFM